MARIFIGVDQTGAIDKKGKPKPLPACFIRNKTINFTYLDQFSKDEILEKIHWNKNEEVTVCVDCVLGLPKELQIPWRQALKRIRLHPGYGRPSAQSFFKEMGKGKIYHREVEVLSRSNSVFKERPFQKNIQTGTYRIWKDISLNENDFYVPCLSEKPKPLALPIFEGYPSYSWRLLFGTRTREPQNLKKLMNKRFSSMRFTSAHQKQVDLDPNLADALVLALTIKTVDSDLVEVSPLEGWILGFPKESS